MKLISIRNQAYDFYISEDWPIAISYISNQLLANIEKTKYYYALGISRNNGVSRAALITYGIVCYQFVG